MEVPGTMYTPVDSYDLAFSDYYSVFDACTDSRQQVFSSLQLPSYDIYTARQFIRCEAPPVRTGTHTRDGGAGARAAARRHPWRGPHRAGAALDGSAIKC